jgi:hypothetical protein
MIERLRDFGLDQRGSIFLENVDTTISALADRVAARRGRFQQFTPVWAEIESRIGLEGTRPRLGIGVVAVRHSFAASRRHGVVPPGAVGWGDSNGAATPAELGVRHKGDPRPTALRVAHAAVGARARRQVPSRRGEVDAFDQFAGGGGVADVAAAARGDAGAVAADVGALLAVHGLDGRPPDQAAALLADLAAARWCRTRSPWRPGPAGQLGGCREAGDVADLGDEDCGQDGADTGQGLYRGVSGVVGQPRGGGLGGGIDLGVECADQPQQESTRLRAAYCPLPGSADMCFLVMDSIDDAVAELRQADIPIELSPLSPALERWRR